MQVVRISAGNLRATLYFDPLGQNVFFFFFNDTKPYVEDVLKVGRSKTPVLGPLSQCSNAGLCGGIIQPGVSSGTEEVRGTRKYSSVPDTKVPGTGMC